MRYIALPFRYRFVCFLISKVIVCLELLHYVIIYLEL